MRLTKESKTQEQAPGFLIGLVSGSVTYASDAEKARYLMKNIDSQLNDIKRSSANDGLVAVSSQYIPKTFKEPDTGKTRTNMNNPDISGIIDIENRDMRIAQNPAVYRQYLYLGIYNDRIYYFSRLDINRINHNGDPDKWQIFAPEILWEPETNSSIHAKPVVYNNTVYASTFGAGYDPIELAGFDIDTKQMVFYQIFGDP